MTVESTDKFLVSRDGSSYYINAENMAELKDDDLMLVCRDGNSYKATGQEIKDSLGGGGSPTAPTIGDAVLTGPSSFAGGTFTTFLTEYNSGNPAAQQSLKAKVVGPYAAVGETSPITGFSDGSNLGTTYNRSRSGQLGTIETDNEWKSNVTGYSNALSSTSVVLGTPGKYYFETVGSGGNNKYIGLARPDIAPSSWGGDTSLGLSLHANGTLYGSKKQEAYGLSSNISLGKRVGVEIDTGAKTVRFSEEGVFGRVVNLSDFTTWSDGDEIVTMSAGYAGNTVFTYWGPDDFTFGPPEGGSAWTSGPVLTLTDDTNLHNGLFEVGDAVVGSTNPIDTLSFVGLSGGSSTVRAYQNDGNQVYSSGNSPFSAFNDVYDNIVVNEPYWVDDVNTEWGAVSAGISTGASGSPTGVVYTFSYSGSSPGQEIAIVGTGYSGSVSEWSVSGNVEAIPDLTFIQTRGVTPRERYVLTTTSETGTFSLTWLSQSTALTYFTFIGPAEGSDVTITAISAEGVTPPTMTVSGGTWTEGETVKNTVARYPRITPTSDEVVGLIESATLEPKYPEKQRSTLDMVWEKSYLESIGVTAITGFYFPEVTGIPAEYYTQLTKFLLNGIQFNVNNLVQSSPDAGSQYPTRTWQSILQNGGNYVTPSYDVLGDGGYYCTFDAVPVTGDLTSSSLVYNPAVATQYFTGFGLYDQGGRKIPLLGITENTPTQLVLASSAGLPNFSDGMNVTQSGSGYTPVTDTITQVDEITNQTLLYAPDPDRGNPTADGTVINNGGTPLVYDISPSDARLDFNGVIARLEPTLYRQPGYYRCLLDGCRAKYCWRVCC